MKTEKKLQTETKELPKWENADDYQQSLYNAHEHEDPDELEYFLLHHPKNLESKKVRGEEELFGWLAENLEKKYGRKPMVELNEKGIIVPINAEEE